MKAVCLKAATGGKEEIDEEDGDEEEAAGEVMGLEAEHSLFAARVGGWDGVGFVIVGLMSGHGHQLMRKCGGVPERREICDAESGYSSRPGRDMSSRMASLGLLLWWRIASICSVMGISTA